MPADRDDPDDLFNWDAPPQHATDSNTYGLAAPEPLPERATSPSPELAAPNESRPPRRRKKKRKAVRSGIAKPQAAVDATPDDEPPRKKRKPPPIPSLVSSLWFPLTGSGWWVVPALGFTMGLGQLVPIPIVDTLVKLLVTLHVALLFLETANYTLQAIETGPRMPLLGWESLPAGMYGLTTVMIALIPMGIGAAILKWLGVATAVPYLLLTACGMFYIPMGFLALAELENEHALNPLLVIRGILRMGSRYFALVSIAGAIYVLPAFAIMRIGMYPFFEVPLRAILLVYTTTAVMRAVAISFRTTPISFERTPDADKEEEIR